MPKARHMHRSMVAVLAFAASAVAYGQDCEPADLFPNAQTFGTWSGRTDALASGDLNNDGAIDLVAAHNLEGVYVLLATRPGTFDAAVAYGGRTSRLTDVALGDFDNDGFLDIAAAKPSTDPAFAAVLVLLNNGDGTFGDATEWRFSDLSEVVTISDINADGNADLIVGDQEGGTQAVLGVRLGNGDGTFDDVTLLNASAFPRALAVGDLNGDGRQDVVLATFASVDVFFGTPGGLSGAVPFATTIIDSSSGVAIEDVDSDGDPDIVFAARPGGGLGRVPGALFNDGMGGFDGPIFAAESVSVLSLAIGDIDGDGNVDAVGTNSSDTHLWLGDGAGGFTFELTLGPFDSREDVVLADLDNDGATDIAATGFNDIEVRINQCSSFLPVITQQPPLSVVADSGTIVRIAVEAGLGTPPLAYRWRRNGVPLIEGSPYQGVRSSELAIRASSEETDVYDVVVSNPIGSVPSRPVVLAVRDTCIADLDNDGSLTIFDFLAFQTAFDAGCP
ncbi:MAG: FG-GAP-like repeat-containing protein [Planctomycetota bacterium]